MPDEAHRAKAPLCASKKDRWDSSLYEDRHSYVWKKGEALIELLDLKPGHRVLDLGCGTGHLTAQIAAQGADVTGIDSSASMIAQARQNFPKLKFVLGDGSAFRFESPFDRVFSNAALHWMPEAESVIATVRENLNPEGLFVLEMGAKGNIARIVSALSVVLREAGHNPRSPWYFPSAAQYAGLLEKYGFEIEALWTFDRPSELDHPEKGLREWLEMFAGVWFEGVPAPSRAPLITELESRLRPALFRGGRWRLDYRRLRVVARKL